MADRPRDLWDVLNQLTVAASPDIQSSDQIVDDFVIGTATDNVALADAVSIPIAGHSGVYLYDDATSLYGRAQWG